MKVEVISFLANKHSFNFCVAEKEITCFVNLGNVNA